MARKSFRVQVELEIQSVTCPGVWLCPNGKVSLQLYMLDSCIQTSPLVPVFPLFVDERFVFYKTFSSVNKLKELLHIFNKEHLYAELIQWQDCEVGNVLSTFETSLSELLFPSSCDVDLLMEPTRNYPGIISPKIEICTKTTIDEVCTVDSSKTQSYVVNPKTIPSQDYKTQRKLRQSKVCHSVPYHRKKVLCEEETTRRKKPAVISSCKPCESFASRKPQGVSASCSCDSKKKPKKKTIKRYPQQCKPKPSKRIFSSEEVIKSCKNRNFCRCPEGHKQPNCDICDRYKKRFDSFATPCPAVEPVKEEILTPTRLKKKCIAENRSRPNLVEKLRQEIEKHSAKRNCSDRKGKLNFFGDNRNDCKNNVPPQKADCPCSKFPKCSKLVKKKLSCNSIWEKKNFIGKFDPKNLPKEKKRCSSGNKKCIASIKKTCKLVEEIPSMLQFYKKKSQKSSSPCTSLPDISNDFSKSANCLEKATNYDEEFQALISKYCGGSSSTNISFSGKNKKRKCDTSSKIFLNTPKSKSQCVLGNPSNEEFKSGFTKSGSCCQTKKCSYENNSVGKFSKTSSLKSVCFDLPKSENSCNSDVTVYSGKQSSRSNKSRGKKNKLIIGESCTNVCHLQSSRVHPFQKQIEARSKPPPLKHEKSRNDETIWCPYYGTPCSSNKTLSERVKTLSDRIREISRSDIRCTDSYEKPFEEEDSDCDNNSSLSLESDEGNCVKKYYDERKRFSDSLNKFCDSLYRKIQNSYSKYCDDECRCCNP